MGEEAVPGIPASDPVCEEPKTEELLWEGHPRPTDAGLARILHAALMVAVILIPVMVGLAYFDWKSMPNYESRSRLAMAAGSWAVFAVWIILDKGLVSLLGRLEMNPDFLWLVVGLINLGAALATLSRLAPNFR